MYNVYRSSRSLVWLGAVALAFAAAPARAGDDGQASLISGLASTFGLTHESDPQIDYRERSKLVLPRSKTLPPPASSAAGGVWPTGNEALRDAEEKKIEDASPSARQVANPSYQFFNAGQEIKVTTSGFDRHGPTCRVPDPKTGECPEEAHPSMNWNPMTWVGLEKKPKVTLGAEPVRQNLTDPPVGYRAPAEGVGAKIDD